MQRLHDASFLVVGNRVENALDDAVDFVTDAFDLVKDTFFHTFRHIAGALCSRSSVERSSNWLIARILVEQLVSVRKAEKAKPIINNFVFIVILFFR